MIEFDKSDGSIAIDFPNGRVRVRPPLFGGLKRLRSERVRLAREAQDKLTAWEAEHPKPDGDDVDEADIARHAEDRIVAAEQANIESTEAWWRLILVGDDSFKRLTDDPVPESVDDWPAALLFDVRPLPPPLAAGQRYSTEMLLSMQSTPDRVVRHWGEARSRFLSGNGAGQPTSQ